MINLVERSNKKELLDAEDIPFISIRQTMKELNIINNLLGGHAITVAGIRQFIKGKKQKLHVCEIGCGGGDNLKAIDRKLSDKKIDFTGVDIKEACVQFAQQRYPELGCKWIASDYKKVSFKEPPDVIFSSLFCHHFTNEELLYMLQWMHKNSVGGFFINDLQRSAVAYYLIKWLTGIFSRSVLVKNDACISVARGFKKKDWEALLHKAGIENYSVQWRWAFRYLVICRK